MKVLFILEAGIPEYRNFLFERLAKEDSITELLILHNGLTYGGDGEYPSKKLKYIGNSTFGFHLGVLNYIFKYDIVVSSYNLRIISCWLPVFLKKKWIFWGKGLGSNESKLVEVLRRVTARSAWSILVYNDVKKEEFVNKIGCNSEKIIAYQNTVQISNPGFRDGIRDYFTYFGRIQERKGLEDLIVEYDKYLKIRTKENKEFYKLKFVGNGDYKDHLTHVVDELKINDNVEFYDGAYSDEEIKKHFKNTVAYVSPNNVGLAVINSFAYGVPVITAKELQVGPEFFYLNNENSFLVDKIENIHSIFNKISDMDLNKMRSYCYNYFLSNLTADIMYKNFYRIIQKTYNE